MSQLLIGLIFFLNTQFKQLNIICFILKINKISYENYNLLSYNKTNTFKSLLKLFHEQFAITIILHNLSENKQK